MVIWPPGPKARLELASARPVSQKLRTLALIVRGEVKGRKQDKQQLKTNEKLDLREGKLEW